MPELEDFSALLTEKELEALFAEFLAADTNNDGSLDYVEFYGVIASKVKVEAQIPSWFKLFDTDGNGVISITEFIYALAIARKGSVPAKLAFLFRVYDTNHDDVLSKEEITVLVTHLKTAASVVVGKDDEFDEAVNGYAQNLVQKLDFNQDGKISLEEWLTVGAKTPAILNLLSPKI